VSADSESLRRRAATAGLRCVRAAPCVGGTGGASGSSTVKHLPLGPSDKAEREGKAQEAHLGCHRHRHEHARTASASHRGGMSRNAGSGRKHQQHHERDLCVSYRLVVVAMRYLAPDSREIPTSSPSISESMYTAAAKTAGNGARAFCVFLSVSPSNM
jgi:hypothetical protein